MYKFRGLRLEGKKFNSLTVIEWSPPKNAWRCVCDCGKETFVGANKLEQGRTKSCGCITKNRHEETKRSLIGKKFGTLTCVDAYSVKRKGIVLLCKCTCGKMKEIVNSKAAFQQSCGCRRNQPRIKPVNNLTGKRFGNLVVKDYSYSQFRWRCLCDCGKEKYVTGSNLKKGDVKSCGCLRKALENLSGISLIGKKYGLLKVLDFCPVAGEKAFKLKCKCSCKTITYIDKCKWGITKSCGCIQKHLLAGEKAPQATLSNEQAALVRKLFKSRSGFGMKNLAQMFDVGQRVIYGIVKNETYVDVK